MYVILQIDGGDIKGIVPAYLLKYIESNLGFSVNRKVHLASGTSTGAVIAGAKAAGIPASTIYDFYVNEVIEAFKHKRKHWYSPSSWNEAVYYREDFTKLLKSVLGNKTLAQSEIDYTAVAYGLRKDESHFIKSWKTSDQSYTFVDVISWSALSAVNYFGSIAAPNYKWSYVNDDGVTISTIGEVFNDGGQGVNNCSLYYDLTELCTKSITSDEKVIIISLGCGKEYTANSIRSYEDALNIKYFKQILLFPWQARQESIPNQVGAFNYISKNNGFFKQENLHFYRFDFAAPKKALEFGNFDYKDFLVEKAQALASSNLMSNLIETLKV